jgi:type II secretory pathway component PulJ
MRLSFKNSGLCAHCHRYGGFTLVELCLGMLITTLVMSGIAAFSLAMTRGWEESGRSQTLSLTATQVTARLQRNLRDAKRIGECRSGSLAPSGAPTAAVAIWVGDSNGDRKIQSNEVQVLMHDAEQRVLAVRRVGSEDESVDISRETFESPSIFSVMDELATDVQVMARDVEGMLIVAARGDEHSIKPCLQFVLKFQKQKSVGGRVVREGSSWTEFGTATLRGPANESDPIS